MIYAPSYEYDCTNTKFVTKVHLVFSYTLFTNHHLDPTWRGRCYGRNLYNQVNEAEEYAISGYQHPCQPCKLFHCQC